MFTFTHIFSMFIHRLLKFWNSSKAYKIPTDHGYRLDHFVRLFLGFVTINVDGDYSNKFLELLLTEWSVSSWSSLYTSLSGHSFSPLRFFVRDRTSSFRILSGPQLVLSLLKVRKEYRVGIPIWAALLWKMLQPSFHLKAKTTLNMKWIFNAYHFTSIVQKELLPSTSEQR